ncbi:MAG: mannose-1-phosphate guanylyltransferase [Bradymonadales bacterium]|nr:mannose-1-phosphate guanylyltransferase [Bradymonadales bacterium]
MRHVVIMAGGLGTRFWPLSRTNRPKQLLPLWDGKTLLEHTVARLGSLVPRERLYIVTGRHLEQLIRAHLPELASGNLIVEPTARSTAPAIGLAATVIGRLDAEAIVGFFPSDAYVGRPDLLVEACNLGFEAADQGYIATIGIRPTHPETGYGYIRCETGGGAVLKAAAFVEKPDFERARSYVIDGRYLWNSGIFFFSLAKLKEEMGRQLPELARHMTEMDEAMASGDDARLQTVFEAITPISIDYGVMEGAQDVVVVPADLGWNDVGHWASLGEVLATDEQGNLCIGEVCPIDVEGSILINQGGKDKVLAVVGVEDLVVVDTDTATLVLPKKLAQRVREVVEWLKNSGREDLL